MSNVILNLDCGTKVSDMRVDIDWSIHLRIAKSQALLWAARRVATQDLSAKLKNLGPTSSYTT